MIAVEGICRLIRELYGKELSRASDHLRPVQTGSRDRVLFQGRAVGSVNRPLGRRDACGGAACNSFDTNELGDHLFRIGRVHVLPHLGSTID
jgi:hypothetical protein